MDRRPEQNSPSAEQLEQARNVLWEALQMVEEAQRVLFRAGDHYVAQVWGDGVRSVIESTERMAEVAGDISALHIEIGRLVKRDNARGSGPPA